MNQFKVFTSQAVLYVTATDKEAAIQSVMASEICPRSAIRKVYLVKVWTDAKYYVEQIDDLGRFVAVISHRGKTEWSRSHAFALAKECRGKGWKCRVVEA